MELLKNIIVIAGFIVGTAIPFVVSLVNNIKKRKAAQTEAEKQAALNDMLLSAQNFIGAAEETWKQVNTLMKNQGLGSCGAVKKEAVMTKLQALAIEKGYDFDAEYWSAKIDEIVALTRKVNVK